jgi:hypothetical protein
MATRGYDGEMEREEDRVVKGKMCTQQGCLSMNADRRICFAENIPCMGAVMYTVQLDAMLYLHWSKEDCILV